MPDSREDDKARPPRAYAAPQGLSRWTAPVALLVAVVAVALAIWSLMSESSTSTAPAGSAAPAGEASQPGDAKTRVCAAFETVADAVSMQTNADLGPDPTALAAVAGNARLALFGGGQYLLNSLDSETPAELAATVRGFANDLQEIGMHALAGAQNSEPEQAARMTRGDTARLQIVEMCR